VGGYSQEANAQPSEIQSMRVPRGLQANLYLEKDEKELYRTLTGDTSVSGEDKCFNFGQGKYKSVEVTNDYEDLSAYGTWRLVEQTSEKLEYKYSVGLDSKNSQATETEKKESIEASMEVGVDFLGTEDSFSLTAKYESNSKTDVQNVMDKDVTTTMTFTCTPEGDDAVSLYQWYVYSGSGEVWS